MLDLGEVEGGQQGGVPLNEEAGRRGELDGLLAGHRVNVPLLGVGP